MDHGANCGTHQGGLTLTDKDVFVRHIRQYERTMYALAFSIVRNTADAAEVISESIYRAYKNLDTLKQDASFKPWILRIVHNTAVELIRKNEKITSVEEIPEAFDAGNENTIVTKLALRAAVKQLQIPYRTVVVLFYFENFSILEIAQITGVNILAVRKQLSRARKMLREILQEDFSNA